MSSDTFVVKLARPAQERLEKSLRSGDYEFRSVPYSRFSARGEGVVVTQYTSGKLVVQGSGLDVFRARYLGDAAPLASKSKSKSKAGDRLGDPPPGVAVVGSDETGKGDYFGPLVVVAVRVPAGEREKLSSSQVTDSKKLTDEACARLAPALMDRYAHAIERLDPPAYNDEHARQKNLNPMLADLHARAIRTLANDGDRVVVDRFAAEQLVASRLGGLDVELIQTPRAESLEPAVAAASVIARYTFVEALAELSERFAVDLHKGAGRPTDQAARAFVKLHGREELGAVAKLHFKNTQKLGG